MNIQKSKYENYDLGTIIFTFQKIHHKNIFFVNYPYIDHIEYTVEPFYIELR